MENLQLRIRHHQNQLPKPPFHDLSASLPLYIEKCQPVLGSETSSQIWFTRTEEQMKRQRSGLGSETTRLPTRKVTKKKAKTRVGEMKEEVAVAKVKLEDQIRDDREFAGTVKAEDMVHWDDWPCLWAAVDEQMSWGTCWSPSWDMEFMDGEAYHALYSDVVWEDDIWDLKDIKNVPSLPGP